MAMPFFVAAGSAAGGTGSPTPGIPAGLIGGDLMLLFVETANQALAAPAGWTEITNSPQGTGAAGDAAATRLSVFYRLYDNGLAAAAIGDSGDHQEAVILGFRGAAGPGDPTHASSGGASATSDTSASVPGTTTTVADCLVVVACTTGVDLTGAQFSDWANASLSDVTERFDNATNAGNGGGIGIITGGKAAAGATGTTTATLANASAKAYMTIALGPSETPWIAGIGAGVANTTSITPTWPTHVAGDIGLLFIETANQPVAAPAGWVEVTNSPQGTGAAGDAAATCLQAFWKRATSDAETNPTVADAGDHQNGYLVGVRNCIATGDPWNVTAGSVKAASNTDVSVSGANTTVNDCLVLVAVATGFDIASTAGLEFSTWTNANLAGLVEVKVYIAAAGNGGGVGLASGTLATAGATGTTTATLANAFANGQMMIALKPPGAAAVSGRSFAVIIA